MDIYRKEAARYFNIPYEAVTEDQREEVKKLAYSTQYGGRPSIGMPIEDEIPLRSEHDKKVFKELFESFKPSMDKVGKAPIFFGTKGQNTE